MIDNPVTAMELLEQLTEALPIPARMTPELQMSLRGQNIGIAVPINCNVMLLHYMGDEGGIVCKLDLGPGVDTAAFVSITHQPWQHEDARAELEFLERLPALDNELKCLSAFDNFAEWWPLQKQRMDLWKAQRERTARLDALLNMQR